MRWYVSQTGETYGPMQGAAVSDMIRTGQIGRGVYVRDEAGGPWTALEASPFASLLQGAPAPAPALAQASPSTGNGLGYAIMLTPLGSTALVWLWVGNMNLLQDPSSTLWVVVGLTFLATAILMAVEASQLGMGRLKGSNGKVQSGPVAWFLAAFLLWLVAIPFYLYARSKYGKTNLAIGGICSAVVFTASFALMNSAIESKKAEVRRHLNNIQQVFAPQ